MCREQENIARAQGGLSHRVRQTQALGNGPECAAKGLVSSKSFPKVQVMLRMLGTIGAVMAGAALYERLRPMKAQETELERTAAAELRKVLLYAAPPTFLAPAGVPADPGPQRRWLDKAASD